MITTEIVLRSIKKRNNVVGSPEIDSFSGALRRKRADRGVFITTSSFTSGAKEAAKQLNIALVDGEMLTNLMVQYKVGVQVQQTYESFDPCMGTYQEYRLLYPLSHLPRYGGMSSGNPLR